MSSPGVAFGFRNDPNHCEQLHSFLLFVVVVKMHYAIVLPHHVSKYAEPFKEFCSFLWGGGINCVLVTWINFAHFVYEYSFRLPVRNHLIKGNKNRNN